MELFFGEFIKQLIAAILALFMPFTSIGTAISNNAAQSRTTVTVPSVSQQATADAVAAWDVSGTENDEVIMTYYDTENASLIDNVTASIASLFAPMTAYAAEEEEAQEPITTYTDGTVVLSGSGATEQYIFLKWLNAEKFVPYYENWCAEHGYRDGTYYAARDSISIDGIVTGSMATIDEAHNAFYTLEDMIAWYIPVHILDCIRDTENFWETYATFNPKHIVIQGDITTISFAAFAFCTNVADIAFNTDTLTAIESCAFSSTDVTAVTLPEGLETIGHSVFANCTRLAEVYLPSTLTEIGNYTFNDMPDDASIVYAGNAADLLASPNAVGRAVQADDRHNNNFNPAMAGNIISVNDLEQ